MMFKVFVMLALLSTGLHAQEISQETVRWSGLGYQEDSYVTLGPPEVEDAETTVTFKNTMVHSETNDFNLSFNGISVSFKMVFGVNARGDEGLYILCPPGYIARPDYLQVKENTTEKSHIFKWVGS